MSNSARDPFGNPWQSHRGGFLSDHDGEQTVPQPNVVKVLGGDFQGSAHHDAEGRSADLALSGGMAQLKGTAGNDWASGTGTMDVLAGRASGHLGYTTAPDGSFTGAGAQGASVAYGEHVNVAGELGNSQKYASVQGSLDGAVGMAQAKGQVLLGDDGRYQGVALGGVAEAAALDGTASAGASARIDWIPFVPKGWTVNVKGYAEGQVLSAGAGAGGYIMRDRADNRVHVGLFAGLSLGLGAFLGSEISFGPAALTPQQQAEAAANAKAAAAAEAAAAAADLIRPMARITDPIGAHGSSHGWLGMALGALVAIAAIVCFPVIIGVGVVGAGLLGAAMIGLGAVSLVTGGMAVGAKLGKLIKTEDGSSCSEIGQGAPRTFCEGLAVARVTDANKHGAGKLKTGAKMVLDGNLNVSRVKEASTCGAAKVLKGAQRTFVGGPSVSTGAKDEPTAGDATLDKVIGVLDTISTVTGLAQLPLLAISALKTGGSLALSKIAGQAVERAAARDALQVAAKEGLETAAMRAAANKTVVTGLAKGATVAAGAGKELAKQAAAPALFAAASHYGQPAISSGLQSRGMSKEAAEAFSQGLFLAGPAAFATHGIGRGATREEGTLGLTPENAAKWSAEKTNLGESVSSFKEGNYKDAFFGKPKTDAAPGGTPAATDDVAGGASETFTTRSTSDVATPEHSRPEPRVEEPEVTTSAPAEAPPVRDPEATTTKSEPTTSATTDASGGGSSDPINVLRPTGEGDHWNIESLPPDTPIYRVQDKNLAIEPHDSPFFDPTAYSMPNVEYQALYMSTDRNALMALRQKQDYFTSKDADGNVIGSNTDMVMHETTVGEVLKNAGPGATIVQDTKFNMTVLGREEGGYVFIRRKDGAELPRSGREMTPEEQANLDAPAQRAKELQDEATQRSAVLDGGAEAASTRSDLRSATRDLGDSNLSDSLREAAQPLGFGGKEIRNVKQPELESAANQLQENNASGKFREAAANASPENASQLNAVADRIDAFAAKWGKPPAATAATPATAPAPVHEAPTAACATCGGASKSNDASTWGDPSAVTSALGDGTGTA